MDSLDAKLEKLKHSLAGRKTLAVAFSGGVDSTFLLDVAHECLGANVLAITARAAFVPAWETDEAITFCEARGIAQTIRRVDVLQDERIAANPENRCYLCKRLIFSALIEEARARGIDAVADGTNASDMGDYRPGMQALQELGVVSPLLECGFAKHDIREASRRRFLPTADRQSHACLATRFPYGQTITQADLCRVEAAEELFRAAGFEHLRIRSHGVLARIEVPENDFGALMQPAIRRRLVEGLKRLGFAYVSLDLEGFRSGSMNETLGGTR